MAIQETAELQVGPAENPLSDGQLEESRLSRRDFLKILLTGAGAVFFTEYSGLGHLGNVFEGQDGKKFGLKEKIRLLQSLNLDPDTVSLRSQVNADKVPQSLELSFISRNTGFISDGQKKKNYTPRATRIRISVGIKSEKDYKKWVDQLSNAAQFFQKGTRLLNAVRNNDTVLFSSLIAFKGKKTWIIPAILLAGQTACAVAGTQSPDEATGTLEDLFTPTSLPESTNGNQTQTEQTQPVLEITELPGDFTDVKNLSREYLLSQWKIIQSNLSLDAQPTPAAAATSAVGPIDADPLLYSKILFADESLDPANDPMATLKYLVAQGARLGSNGTVTYFAEGNNGQEEVAAFSGLAIYREKLNQPGEYQINAINPRNLVIRGDTNISILGKGNDGNLVIAFEEYLERIQGQANPRIRFAVISPQDFLSIRQLMPILKFDPNNSDQLVYSDSFGEHHVMLNKIDDEIMNLIKVDSGPVWADYFDPNGPNRMLMPQPVVPFPQDELLQGRNMFEFSYNLISDSSLTALGGQYAEAVSNDNQYRLYSLYDQENNNWLWTEGLKTDTWAADSTGSINKDVMAGVVNKALIEDKYAFDMYFGEMKVAVVEDNDLTEANLELLNEKRSQAKSELENDQALKCVNQLLQAIKELESDELNLSECTAIIERNFEGNLQLTNIVVKGKRLYMSTPVGELFRIPDVTPQNGEIYGLDREIPMFPELIDSDKKFSFSSPMQADWLPLQGRPDSRAEIIDDPTGVFPGKKVFLTEIMTQFQPQNETEKQDDRHRPYYPGPNRDPFSPPPGYNTDKDNKYPFYTGWNLPVVMKSTIYIDEIQPDIGLNVHKLGPAVAGNGQQIFALAGDYHIPLPGFPDNYTGDSAGVNTLLAQDEDSGKYYILPMNLDQPSQQFHIGRFIEMNNSIPLKQWVEYMTISSNVGVWTLMRIHGKNHWRAMGFIERYNPSNMPAVSANFGPYALPTVSKFKAYQKDLIVEAWGDAVFIPSPQSP